ncbi:UNVERIFIED_CONTAM: hypothetical protein Slati_2907600, partial [Sesamum latifolium]
PLPPLGRVYALVIQEERHSQKPVVTTFSRHEKPVCSNCGKFGHESASCFKLIGYPDWWGSSRGNNKILGKGCGGGFGIGLSTRGKGVSGSENAVNTAGHSMPQSNTSGVLTNHDRATLAPVLTDDQWADLLNMFKQSTVKSTEKLSGKCPSLSSWILDTGASHHMTGNKSLLVDLKDISSSVIGMPNGDHTQASQEGPVLLNGHDRTSRMVIGTGEQHRGVFWLHSVASAQKSYDNSVSPAPTSHHPAVYDNDSGIDSSTDGLVRENHPEIGDLTVRGSSRNLMTTENTAGSSDISSGLEFGE